MPRLNLPKPHLLKSPAPIWKRGLALIIDLLIIDTIIAAPFKKILTSMLPSVQNLAALQSLMQSSSVLLTRVSSIMIIISILALLYFAVMQAMLTQTVGMIILNLYVARKGRKKPTFWQCVIRNLFVLPFFPFFTLWIIEPLFLIFRRVRLLELLSGTMTIDTSFINQSHF